MSVQRDLGDRLPREPEGIAGATVGQRRVLAIIPVGNEGEQLLTAVPHELEERGAERPDLRACPRIAGHPLGPVEAIDEVVHVAEPDRRAPTEQMLQSGDPLGLHPQVVDRTAGRLRPRLADERGGQRIEIAEDVVGKRVPHRHCDRRESLRQSVTQRGRVVVDEHPDTDGVQRADPVPPGRQRPPHPGAELGVGSRESVERSGMDSRRHRRHPPPIPPPSNPASANIAAIIRPPRQMH